MWIPRWLGEMYSKLFLSSETELFTFTQAEGALDAEPRRLNVDEKPLYAHTLLDRNCAYLHE
jgi:hypothetical protein